MSIIKEKYFVKDGSRNCFIAEANLKDGSSIFSNGKRCGGAWPWMPDWSCSENSRLHNEGKVNHKKPGEMLHQYEFFASQVFEAITLTSKK